MIIKNITLGNYRLYEGKNIIKFTQDEEKPIFLISGENGFGKTTFLHSLIWCLYASSISSAGISSLKKMFVIVTIRSTSVSSSSFIT